MPLSSSQFGQGSEFDIPLSLSTATTGSAAQATAWSNKQLGAGRPLSLSSKTMGTTFKWDDTSSAPTVPQSDAGANYLRK